MDSKNFLTYNQQMERLRDEKNIECETLEDKKMLVRAGYFNIINGYKNPFTCGRDSDNKHVYFPGTSLKHLYDLKCFDDGLRSLLMKYITQIEEEVRTLVGYKFDLCNDRGKIPWYDIKAYSENSELQSKINAISSAYSELSKSRLEYVKHYMKNHSSIPTWIMIKVVNFSTFINILRNSKKYVTHSICYLYDMTDEEGRPNVKLLIGSLHWLRKIRNSCAHNERIFSARNKGRIKEKYFKLLGKSYNKESEKRLMDLFVYFKYYLPDYEYKKLIDELNNKLEGLECSIHKNAFENIRGLMGIKDLSDLDKLKELTKKEIDYNKFDND